MADTVNFLQNGYNGEVLEDLLTYTAQGNDYRNSQGLYLHRRLLGVAAG